MEPDIYDEFDISECPGNCDECPDTTCSEHPSQRWKYDVEYAEAKFCLFSGIGSYAWGVEYCEFVCPLRELCREMAEQAAEEAPFEEMANHSNGRIKDGG